MTVLRGGGQGFYEDIMENLVLKNETKGQTLYEKLRDVIYVTTPKGFPPNISNFNSPANAHNVGYEALQTDVIKTVSWP